jgi:hypothetical protein
LKKFGHRERSVEELSKLFIDVEELSKLFMDLRSNREWSDEGEGALKGVFFKAVGNRFYVAKARSKFFEAPKVRSMVGQGEALVCCWCVQLSPNGAS